MKKILAVVGLVGLVLLLLIINISISSSPVKAQTTTPTFRIGVYVAIENIRGYGARHGVSVDLTYQGGKNFYNYVAHNGERGYFSAITLELTPPSVALDTWKGQVDFAKGMLDAADADQGGEAVHIFYLFAPINGIQDVTFKNAFVDFLDSIGAGRPSLKGFYIRGEFMYGRPTTLEEYNTIWKPAWWWLHDKAAEYGYVWGNADLAGVLKYVDKYDEVYGWEQYLPSKSHVWAEDNPTVLQQTYQAFRDVTKPPYKGVIGAKILGMWDDMWNTPNYPPYYMTQAKFAEIFRGFYDGFNEEVALYGKPKKNQYLFIPIMPSTFGDGDIYPNPGGYTESPYLAWIYQLALQYKAKLSTTPPFGKTWLGYNDDSTLGTVTINPLNITQAPPSPFPPYPTGVTVVGLKPLPPFSAQPGQNIRVAGYMQEIQNRVSVAGKKVQIWWRAGRYADPLTDRLVTEGTIGSLFGNWYEVNFPAQDYMVQEMTGDAAEVAYFYSYFPGDSNFLPSKSYPEPIRVVNRNYTLNVGSDPETANRGNNPRIHIEATRMYWNYGDKDQNTPFGGTLDANENWSLGAPITWYYPPQGTLYFNHWNLKHLDSNTGVVTSEEDIYKTDIVLNLNSPKNLTAVYTTPQAGTATLIIQTTPVSAEVSLDGRFIGTAPLTVNIPITVPGYRTISFGSYPGYERPPSQTIYLVANGQQTVIGNYRQLPPTNILFEDGFESGLSRWDGTYGSPSVTSQRARSGTYSLRASADVGSINKWESVRKLVTTNGKISVLSWFYPDTTIITGQNVPIATWERTGFGSLAKAFIANVNGELKLRLDYYNGQTTPTLYSNPIALDKRWHSLELIHSPIAGSKIQLFYDNALVAEGTLVGSTPSANQTQIGLLGVDGQALFYFDDVKVGDGFIGSGLQLPPKSVKFSGKLKDRFLNPIMADVSLSNPQTGLTYKSSTDSNGDFSLSLAQGIYDIRYDIKDFYIPNLWIKLFSVNLSEDIYDLVNYITGYSTTNKVYFVLNITSSQTVETYSPNMPTRILQNGTSASFTYDQVNKIVRFVATP